MAGFNLYIPEGTQDILYEECAGKRQIEDKLRELFKSYAYLEIETPVLEYQDVFMTKEGTFIPENMFRFFDEKGKTLVLKPDQTVPAARVAASKLKKSEEISKISYITKTFRFGETGAGKRKEYTQAGCELINSCGPYADAEIIALAVNSMRTAGLEDFQIDIGQVGFFKGIIEESGLDDAKAEIIRDMTDKKDYLGLEEFLKEQNIANKLKSQIIDLPKYFGDIDIISGLKKGISNRKAIESLDRLEQTFGILKDYGLEKYISIDLGMVQSINYYTGIIFKGYTYGVGFPVLNGGRYDTLLGNFGCDMPAVGFSVDINLLLTALAGRNDKKDKHRVDTFIAFDDKSGKNAYTAAVALRAQGLIVEADLLPRTLDDAVLFSKKRGMPGLIHFAKEDRITVVNNLTGLTDIVSYESLTGGGMK